MHKFKSIGIMPFILLLLLCCSNAFAKNIDAYLKGMPHAKEVCKQIKGKDDKQTLIMQIAAFRQLRHIVWMLSGRAEPNFTYKEKKLCQEYQSADSLLLVSLRKYSDYMGSLLEYSSDANFEYTIGTKLLKSPAKEKYIDISEAVQLQKENLQFLEHKSAQRKTNNIIGMIAGILIFLFSIFLMISGFKTLRNLNNLEFYSSPQTPNEVRRRLRIAWWGRKKIEIALLLFFAGIGMFFGFVNN